MSEQDPTTVDATSRDFWIREATEVDRNTVNGYVVRQVSDGSESIRKVSGILNAESTITIEGQPRITRAYIIREIGAVVFHAPSVSAEVQQQVQQCTGATGLNPTLAEQAAVLMIVPAALVQEALELPAVQALGNITPANVPAAVSPNGPHECI